MCGVNLFTSLCEKEFGEWYHVQNSNKTKAFFYYFGATDVCYKMQKLYEIILFYDYLILEIFRNSILKYIVHTK